MAKHVLHFEQVEAWHRAHSGRGPDRAPHATDPSRRRFLGSALALPVTTLPGTRRRQVQARITDTGFAFWCDGQLAWQADTRWLADPASIRNTDGDSHAGILIPRCTVPGTGLVFALRLRLDQDLVLTVSQPDGEEASARLPDWLSDGGPALSLGPLNARLRAHVGTSLAMTQRGPARMFLSAPFTLELQGTDRVFAFAGDEVSGECDTCIIGPAANAPLLADAGTVARLEFTTRHGQPLTLRPACLAERFHCRRVAIERLAIELERSGGATRQSAYAARAARPLRVAFRPRPTAHGGYVTLDGITYAVHGTRHDGPSYLLLADRADAVVRVGDTAYQGSATGALPFRMQYDGHAAAGHFAVAWHGIAMEQDDGISVQIRFKGDGMATGAYSQLEHLLDNVPWHRKRLSLDNATVEFSRPDDALLLSFRFVGYDLARHKLSSHLHLVPRDAAMKMLIDLGSQSWSERAFFEAPGGGAGTEPIMVPSEANLAGPSVLAFLPRGGTATGDGIPLKLENLLDRERWRLHVVPRAQDKSYATPAQCQADSTDERTSLEIPWRLYISPADSAIVSHAPLAMSPKFDLVPLFSLSLLPPAQHNAVGGGRLPAKTESGLALRAIGSPDYSPLDPNYQPPEPSRRNLQAKDRNELVWLTSALCQPAKLGSDDVTGNGDKEIGIYVPRPFYAERLLFTSFGASLRSTGTWDPPTLVLKGVPYGLNIMAWVHVSTLGRDHYDKVVKKGFMLPYGHYATVITETRRELRLLADGRIVAVPIQRNFLSVVEPDKAFPAVGQPPASLYQTFQPERFTITLPAQLQIDDPAASPIAQQGELAFWVRVKRGEDYRVPLRIGSNGHGDAIMAFVANSIVHNPAKLEAVINDYNKTGSAFDARGSRVCFAPEDKPGDTSFATHKGVHKVVLARELVNSVLLESARPRQPPFYPVLDFVDVELNAAGRVQGKTEPPLSTVRYADVYRAIGFGAAAGDAHNPLALFLQLASGVPLGFTGKSERSGGIATPNMTATMYSRSHGLVSQSALPPARAMATAALAQQLKLSNPFDMDAKLLGLLPLGFFFESVGLGELPQLVENVAYRIDTMGQEFEKATKDFLKEVARSIGEVLASLDKAASSDTVSGIFLESAPGKALKAHLGDIRTIALQAQDHDVTQLVVDAETVARDLRLLQGDLEALAALPQALAQGAAKGFVDLVSTVLPRAIEDALKQLAGGVLAAAAKARDDAAALARQLYFETVEQAERDVFAPYMAEIAEAQAESIRAVLRASRAQLDKMATQVFESRQADQFLREGVRYLQLAADLQKDGMALRQAVLAAAPGLQQQIVRCAQAAADMAINTSVAPLLDALFALASQIEQWLRETVGPGCPEAYMRIEPAMRDMVRRARVLTSLDQPRGLDPVALQLARLNACRALLDAIRVLRETVAREAASGCFPLQQFDRAMQAVVDSFAPMRARIDTVKNSLAAAANAIPAGLDDFATNELRNHFNRLVALGQAYDFHTYNEAAMVGVLDAVTGALDRRFAQGALTAAAGIDAVQARAAELARLVWPPMRTVLATVDQKLAGLVTTYSTLPGWQKDILDKLLGPQVFSDLSSIQQQLHTLMQGAGASDDPGWVKLADMPRALAGIADRLDKLLVHLGTALRGLDRALLRYVQDQVRALATALVPARATFNFDLEKQLDRSYGGVFLPGAPPFAQVTTFTLRAVIDVDFMQGKATAGIEGYLKDFRINLMSVMILPVRDVHFRAGDGGFHLDPPQIGDVQLLPPLNFVEMIQKLLGTTDGLFVTPGFNHIRAGYRFARPIIQAFGMTIQNLAFEAAMEIPFDDRPALFSVALGTRDEPCLISVGAYGGGFFLELVMAGSHLVSIESDFCFGLVGAFSLPAVKGSGRVVIQIHYRQASGGSNLSGFFYAGGSARVLSIVSISADLHVPLFHSGGGGKGVGGRSTFGVTIGAGFFKWTLHFPVSYALGGIGLAAEGHERLLACPEDPKDPFTDTGNLLDDRVWKEYLSAFEHGAYDPGSHAQ
ncbi:MAG: hypothetical protein ACXWC2_14385 [Ramlibacter sp.]